MNNFIKLLETRINYWMHVDVEWEAYDVGIHYEYFLQVGLTDADNNEEGETYELHSSSDWHKFEKDLIAFRHEGYDFLIEPNTFGGRDEPPKNSKEGKAIKKLKDLFKKVKKMKVQHQMDLDL